MPRFSSSLPSSRSALAVAIVALAASVLAPVVPSPARAETTPGGTAEPFTIEVPQEVLDDLDARLARARLPDPIEGVGWGYGTDPAALAELVRYWREDYDWREHEARLNELPQFRAEIDAPNGETPGVHFVHVPGTPVEGQDEAVPLLLLHGWPSSFVQFERIIPLLTDPTAHGLSGPAFDVVAPSLVGFGFSDAATRPGMSVPAMAPMMHELMTEVLGYERYGIRSSDLRAGIAAQMALRYPDAVIGSHTGGTSPLLWFAPADLTAEEQAFVETARAWDQAEMAYFKQQATKPLTLAAALNDSPAGMLSWIVEKFHRWSDIEEPDGTRDLANRFTPDELLTNATIYWVTETIGPSATLYLESTRDLGEQGVPQVPIAHFMPANDMFETPLSWVEKTARVDRYTASDEGGHFPEWEVPETVASDLMGFFGPDGEANAVSPDASGAAN